MCNFSQGVWEKGMEVGRKEGAAQTMLNSIQNLMENTGWPIEQVMSMLGVPDADQPKYLEALKGYTQPD